MVIVSREILENLANGVSEAEDNEKLPFDFKDFVENVDHESKVNPYLAKRNIKYVGTGSSRTAYMIPKGSCVDAKTVPVCFKVAKNLAGIKQNETEHKIITRYGKDEPCFTKLYKYDSTRNLCLESEIGAPLQNYDIKKYFADWNSFVEKESKSAGFIDGLKKVVSKLLKKNVTDPGKDLKINETKNIFDILYLVKDFRNIGDSDAKYKDAAKKYVEVMLECGKKNPKYLGLSSLIHVLFDKGAEKELRIGEFSGAENFAMVYRGGKEPVLIPIDYGVTEKVFDDFYGMKKKSTYFSDLK